MWLRSLNSLRPTFSSCCQSNASINLYKKLMLSEKLIFHLILFSLFALREHTCRAYWYYTTALYRNSCSTYSPERRSHGTVLCTHSFDLVSYDSQLPFRSFCLVSACLVLTSFRVYFLLLLVCTALTAYSTVHRHRCYTLIYSYCNHIAWASWRRQNYATGIRVLQYQFLGCVLIREKYVFSSY